MDDHSDFAWREQELYRLQREADTYRWRRILTDLLLGAGAVFLIYWLAS